jgi:CDP-glucose 4,6-dehydratase
LWLLRLGAKVTGVALPPPTSPSLFEALGLGEDIKDIRLDIRNREEVVAAIKGAKPDFIFHLAAQSLVGDCYASPVDAWTVNLVGTINVLEALRKLDSRCSAVLITSDKCYENVEWLWGYRENDRLGGMDPYSASKASAEIAVRSYANSFFLDANPLIRIATARAGNVIGGGDWAENRIVPDCIKKWIENEPVKLRNPSSTRPWQHVLEPLSGYLWLAAELTINSNLDGEPFNFGPKHGSNESVANLVSEMSKFWPNSEWEVADNKGVLSKEASLLQLNCDKALNLLNWHSVMDFQETIKLTADWYKNFYDAPDDVSDLTLSQIDFFSRLAKERKLSWARKN